MSKEVLQLSTNALKIHPRNSEFFDDVSGEDYERFKSSIENEGILTPLVVAPDMTLISGHQRLKAAKDIGLATVPVIVNENLTDDNMKLRALIAANFGRLIADDSLKWIKATAEYVKLVGNQNGGDRKSECHRDTLKKSWDDIAKELGISRKKLARAIAIENKLSEPLKEFFYSGEIGFVVASDILASLSPEEQTAILEKLDAGQSYTAKQIKAYVDEVKQKNDALEQKNKELKALKESAKEKDKKISELESEVKEPQTITVVDNTAVDSLQKEFDKYKKDSEKDYKNLQKSWTEKVKENQDLRKQIDTLENQTVGKEYEKQLKDSVLIFCGRINNFIQDVGGYVWLTEKINELPELERTGYIKAVNAIKSWADTMIFNIDNNIVNNIVNE